MTLEEFAEKFAALKARGWVRSKRNGPTGVGHTLEEIIGLSENNISLPDIEGEVELKAHRINSTSMITLFTFNRGAWHLPPLEAVKKYGTEDRNGRLGLYFTMSQTPNSAGLFLDFDDEAVCVKHTSGELVAKWLFENIAERFRQKLPNLLLVGAFSEIRGRDEFFKYDRAQLMKNTSGDVVANQIKAGNILIDLRLHDRGTRARNHGTGFRAYKDKLPLLFSKVEDIR